MTSDKMFVLRYLRFKYQTYTVETEIVDTLVKASKNAFTSQINGHNLETLGQIRRKS